MREVAVIETGNREHSRDVEEQRGSQGGRRNANPEHAKTGDMQAKEGQRP